MNNSQMIQTDLTGVLTQEEILKIDAELSHVPYKPVAAIDELKIIQANRVRISDECRQAIARHLEMSSEDLEGVATFYNLIYRKPVGKKVILFCDSVSCWICGCDSIKARVTEKLGIDYGQTTNDNRYTLLPVPCLGACDRAPVMMVGDDLLTNLTEDKVDQLFPDNQAEDDL